MNHFLEKQKRTHSPDCLDNYNYPKTEESMDNNFNPGSFIKHKNFSLYSSCVGD